MNKLETLDGDAAVFFGEPVKALGKGRVGGYLVMFASDDDPDLDGDFFTKSTYLGPRDGDGVDAIFQHGKPMRKGMEELADHLFAPLKTKRDDLGIWAETVLDLSDSYEKLVNDLAQQGKLGWSSGSALHMIRKKLTGEITRWPIIEGSLTPIPAEPRNMITTIKAIARESFSMDELPTMPQFEKHLREVGFSRTQAKAICSKGLGHLLQREAGLDDILAVIRSAV